MVLARDPSAVSRSVGKTNSRGPRFKSHISESVSGILIDIKIVKKYLRIFNRELIDINFPSSSKNPNRLTCLKETACVPDVQNSLTKVSLSVVTTTAALHKRDSGSCNSKTTSYVELE